jgi:hypothetical protein
MFTASGLRVRFLKVGHHSLLFFSKSRGVKHQAKDVIGSIYNKNVLVGQAHCVRLKSMIPSRSGLGHS